MRYTLIDPRFVELKVPRKSKRIRANAPPMPALRFGILKEWVEGDGVARSERQDGYLLTYSSPTDSAIWSPPRHRFGFTNKQLTWQNAAMQEDISCLLGFPEANPGWDEGVLQAKHRVEDGYWLKFIAKARDWRRKWFIEAEPLAPRETRRLNDEIGKYVAEGDN